MRPSRLLLPATLVVFLSGCAAGKATYHIMDAEAAVKRAEEHGAGIHAIYEYTLAQRYVEKAREEAGYSQFRAAVDLAKASAGFADQAVIFIEQTGKNVILPETVYESLRDSDLLDNLELEGLPDDDLPDGPSDDLLPDDDVDLPDGELPVPDGLEELPDAPDEEAP